MGIEGLETQGYFAELDMQWNTRKLPQSAVFVQIGDQPHLGKVLDC